jgi:hypothetical protein
MMITDNTFNLYATNIELENHQPMLNNTQGHIY